MASPAYFSLALNIDPFHPPTYRIGTPHPRNGVRKVVTFTAPTCANASTAAAKINEPPARATPAMVVAAPTVEVPAVAEEEKPGIGMATMTVTDVGLEVAPAVSTGLATDAVTDTWATRTVDPAEMVTSPMLTLGPPPPLGGWVTEEVP